MRSLAIIFMVAASSVFSVHAVAATFSDNFNAGASPQWQNDVGAWSAAGGVYSATAPSNFPNAHSSLPFSLTDFTVDVDVLAGSDGGVWLRGANAAGSIGVNGVLFVNSPGGTFYWHVVTDGSNYGASLNAAGSYTLGTNFHLQLTVAGDNYSALVNGTPVTSLTTSAFASGFTALYDNSAQSFDNFSVTGAGVAAVPEPSTYALMLAGLGFVGFVANRRRKALERVAP